MPINLSLNALSSNALKKGLIPAGEHEAIISGVTRIDVVYFDFKLTDGRIITEYFEIEASDTWMDIARLQQGIVKIRELAASTGVDADRINTLDELREAFTDKRCVVVVEHVEGHDRINVEITRFAPSKLPISKARTRSK